MSQVLQKPMTSEEFLAWEARQEFKWEFDGQRPVAMTGGSFGHSRVQGNLITALNNRLRGKPCQACGPDVRVPTIPGRYRYPDAVVVCTPISLEALQITDPVVIFEVLSDSTMDTDRTDKVAEYCALPSVQRYVMLDQKRAWATSINRIPTGWGFESLDASRTLALLELGIELPIAELYEGLSLPQSDPSP